MGAGFPDGPDWRAHLGALSVYTLRAPGSRHVRYVGLTDSPRTRWLMHLCEARQHERRGKANAKDAWILGLLAKGKRPVMDVVEYVGHDPLGHGARRLGRKRGEAREQAWIRRLTAEGAPLLNKAGTASAAQRHRPRA